MNKSESKIPICPFFQTNKRGQIFLIAAIVIVFVLLGFSSTTNTAVQSKEDSTVYDLSKEINFESVQVIDSGVYNSQDDITTFQNVEYLTDFYSNATTKSDFLVLIGNENEITLILYEDTETGYVGLSFGGSTIQLPTGQPLKHKETFQRDDNIKVILDAETEYTFRLRPGQVFFLILKKEKEGERFIALPKEE